MQRRLILVRHAKTEQGSPDVRRELTERGRRDAAAIGQWLAANDAVPELVLVSNAVRAQQTWQLAAAELTGQPPVRVDDRIYDNTVDDVLASVRDAGAAVATLAVVGHNPSLGALSTADSFPTAGVAVLATDAEWAQIGQSDMNLTTITTCRA